MRVLRMLLVVVLFAVISVIPASAQTSDVDQMAAASSPSLWIWKFDVSHPYPNPCTINWVKVKLNLMAMDTNQGFHNIKVTSKVYTISGQLVRSTDHGWISPSPDHPIVVIPNAGSLASGTYIIKITGSCPTFGKSETETKKSLVL